MHACAGHGSALLRARASGGRGQPCGLAAQVRPRAGGAAHGAAQADRHRRRRCRGGSLPAVAPGHSSHGGAVGPVVVIDNYDSFTYNLVQYLWDEGTELVVFKNDEKSVAEIAALNPRGVLISPGPGAPEESGIALEACSVLGPQFPLFGVCMGHQCIGQAFGGRVVRVPTGLMHGKQSPVFHDPSDAGGLLQGLASPFMAARYHSLCIDRAGFPEEELKVTAWVQDGTVMAVRHRKYPWIQGVQFHPESIITDNGKLIIRNWLASLPPRA